MKDLTGVVVVRSLKDQRQAKKKYPVDPRKVRMPSTSEYPIFVFRNLDRRQIVGLANNLRLKGDALVADVRMYSDAFEKDLVFDILGTDGRMGGMVSIVALTTVEPKKARTPNE